MNAMVDIIMGVHNGEGRIGRCIESVLRQTYKNWRLIICDDASSDETYKVLVEYQKNDDRIIILRNEKNKGLASSLNNCLKRVEGEYVARIDDDDLCMENRLEIQAKYLEEHPEVDLVGTAAYIFDENGIIGIRQPIEYPKKEMLRKGPFFIHPSIMIRTVVLKSLGGYTESDRTRRGQDWDLWFRFYAKGYQGYNLQIPLIKYHESEKDYNKRNIRSAFGMMKTAYHGYRLLELPIYNYVWVLKPIISAAVPAKFMRLWHKYRLKI